jgi:hypothetical protein
MVSYVRSNFYAGEQFRDLADCRDRAQRWCAETAGMRIHGTTRLRPGEVFSTDELPALKPVPETVFDVPVWTHPKVAPDRHVQVAKALYRACHSICVSPGWSIIGSPFGRTEGVFCDQGHRVCG